MHSVGRGTGTPKDRDEVNRRDVPPARFIFYFYFFVLTKVKALACVNVG